MVDVNAVCCVCQYSRNELNRRPIHRLMCARECLCDFFFVVVPQLVIEVGNRLAASSRSV